MIAESDTTLTQSENNDLEPNGATAEPIRHEIYPVVSDSVKRIAGWLGVAFIVAVILVQQISGYS